MGKLLGEGIGRKLSAREASCVVGFVHRLFSPYAPLRGRLHGEFQSARLAGLKFHLGPQTSLLKKTFAITWRDFEPGLNPFCETGRKFQPGLKFRKTSCNRIKISALAEK